MKQASKPVAELVAKLRAAREVLADAFVEKEEAVDAVLAGLVSGEPTILVGPPGTAKTQLVEALAKMINAKYFYYLLTRFTEPDELLGPLDINALREGVYKRVTKNRLPEAEVVFLDEVFKASSAIRNVLLDLILFKRVLNGAEYVSIPMVAFYTASNEVSTDSEDEGFYDRLTVRCFCRNVSMDKWPELLQKGLKLLGDGGRFKQLLAVDEVRALQEECMSRALSASEDQRIVGKLVEVFVELKQRGVVLSDRRKVKTLLVAAAFSIVNGEGEVSLDSLADAVRVTAPSTEADVEKVEEAIIRAGLSSYSYKIRQLQTLTAELKNVCKLAMSKPEPSEDVLQALAEVVSRARSALATASENPRLRPYARQLEREVGRALRVMEELKREASSSRYSSDLWRRLYEE